MTLCEAQDDQIECKGVTKDSLRQMRLGYDEEFGFLFYVDVEGCL